MIHFKQNLNMVHTMNMTRILGSVATILAALEWAPVNNFGKEIIQ
jgi:hypothetical protein